MWGSKDPLRKVKMRYRLFQLTVTPRLLLTQVRQIKRRTNGYEAYPHPQPLELPQCVQT